MIKVPRCDLLHYLNLGSNRRCVRLAYKPYQNGFSPFIINISTAFFHKSSLLHFFSVFFSFDFWRGLVFPFSASGTASFPLSFSLYFFDLFFFFSFFAFFFF